MLNGLKLEVMASGSSAIEYDYATSGSHYFEKTGETSPTLAPAEFTLEVDTSTVSGLSTDLITSFINMLAGTDHGALLASFSSNPTIGPRVGEQVWAYWVIGTINAKVNPLPSRMQIGPSSVNCAGTTRQVAIRNRYWDERIQKPDQAYVEITPTSPTLGSEERQGALSGAEGLAAVCATSKDAILGKAELIWICESAVKIKVEISIEAGISKIVSVGGTAGTEVSFKYKNVGVTSHVNSNATMVHRKATLYWRKRKNDTGATWELDPGHTTNPTIIDVP